MMTILTSIVTLRAPSHNGSTQHNPRRTLIHSRRAPSSNPKSDQKHRGTSKAYSIKPRPNLNPRALHLLHLIHNIQTMINPTLKQLLRSNSMHRSLPSQMDSKVNPPLFNPTMIVHPNIAQWWHSHPRVI